MEKHYCDNCGTQLTVNSTVIKFEWVSEELDINTGEREFDSIRCLESFVKEIDDILSKKYESERA